MNNMTKRSLVILEEWSQKKQYAIFKVLYTRIAQISSARLQNHLNFLEEEYHPTFVCQLDKKRCI